MRFADTCGSRSGRRPGWELSYPVSSYASSRPAFDARALAASRPNSGSSRIAVACGVRILDTATLNSDIISGVTAFASTPFALAIDFCKLPRWSIAAAAMIPSLFESAFMCFNLPAERDMLFILAILQLQPPEIRLRAPHIPQDL